MRITIVWCKHGKFLADNCSILHSCSKLIMDLDQNVRMTLDKLRPIRIPDDLRKVLDNQVYGGLRHWVAVVKVGKGRQLDDGINFHVLAQALLAHLLQFRQIVFLWGHQKFLGMFADVVNIVGVKEVKQFFQSLKKKAWKGNAPYLLITFSD